MIDIEQVDFSKVRNTRDLKRAVTLANDYERAVAARNEHMASALLARYERMVNSLGYDPLEGTLIEALERCTGRT